jgi:transposase
MWVERARIIWLASQSQRIPTIAVALHLSANTTGRWLKCFNEDGLAGLTDACRSGRPATYTPGQVVEVSATPLTDPQPLRLPFGSWILDRLKGYIFGAFRPATGDVCTKLYERRTAANWADFFAHVET